MNIEEYLKLAQHLDKIGAYTAADITEKNMVKTAADEPQRDTALQGKEPGGGIGGFFQRTLDRSSISLTKYKNREEFIDESFRALNSYIAYASSVGFTAFENKLKQAKKELIVVAKAALGRGSTTYVPPVGTTPSINTALRRATNIDAQANFLDWSQSQAQIYVGNVKYYNYIYYLREAEVEITKKADPNFVPKGIANTPTAITARLPRGGAPASPAPASPSPGSGSSLGPTTGTTGSGGRPSPPRTSVMPGTPINEALARIVFKELKSFNSSASDSDIFKSLRPEQNLSGYKFIGDDPSRIDTIKAAIDATRYSAAKKQKLKVLFEKKLNDAREMAVTQAVTENASGSETTESQPSPFATTEAPISQYPSENTGNLAELDRLISDLEAKATGSDRALFKRTFNADYRVISETFNRLRKNMSPSTASIYDNKLQRLQLAFVGAINE